MKNEKRIEIEKFNPKPNEGLKTNQVELLKRAGYCNDYTVAPYKTTKQIVRDNMFTFFNLIFVLLFLCLLIVGSYKDMLFMIIIVVNTFIGIIQQIRSKHALDKMAIMTMPHCEVIRNKKTIKIKTNELVREDIVIFKSGNQITADSRVVEGEIQVDESLLTGESDPITKKTGDELLSGSVVLTGRCTAILEKVGKDSYANRLIKEAKKGNRLQKSEMMRSLDKIIKVIGFAIIPIGIILFLRQAFILNISLQQATVSTVAALVGMIPEGLYLLTSIALSVSVIKLSRNKTLVHDMNCIETLARVDTLCIDKTGTITQPDMQVLDIDIINKDYKKPEVEDVLGAIYKDNDQSNQTGKAIKQRYNKKTKLEIEKRYPFLSSTKFEGVKFKNGETYLCGSPENIMGKKYYTIENKTLKYIKLSKRVLLLAKLNGTIDKNTIVGQVIPISLVIIDNPIRKEAGKTFEYFKKQGVDIKVISGDNPITVSNIVEQAGIQTNGKYVDFSKISDGDDLYDTVKDNAVFGRVTPTQKRQIVKTFKLNGHCVAMTGDGVNDILALKDADVGISMASGSEAAGQVADLVLLDSNFASMPKIVGEGRRVINNIQRAATLFLVKNIFSFFLSIISIIINIPYPFTPLQLSLISSLTIGIPSFFLALESNYAVVRGTFIKNVLSKAFPGGITNLCMLLFAQLLARVYCLTNSELSTISTILLATVGFIILYNVSKPLNAKRYFVWISMIVIMIITIIFFGGFFNLVFLSLKGIVTLIILMILSYPIFKAIEYLFNKILAVHFKRKA